MSKFEWQWEERIRKQAARIEALEAALREIADPLREGTTSQVKQVARAALAPGEKKDAENE